MNLLELFEKVKSAEPGKFENISDKKAVALLRGALIEVSRLIDGAGDGVVRVPALGNFRVSKVQREVDGRKVSEKRVIFRSRNRKGGALEDLAITRQLEG